MWRIAATGCAAAVGLVLVSVVPAAAMRILGTEGDDVLIGSNASDLIRAKAGDDVVWSRAGSDDVRDGPGDDVLHLGPGNDGRYTGSTSAGDDVVYGGAGRDEMRLSRGHDSAFMGPGRDVVGVWAPYASATVRLGAGSDFGSHIGSDPPGAGKPVTDIGGGPGGDDLSYYATSEVSYRRPPWWRTYAPQVTLRGARGADLIEVNLTYPSGTYTVIAGPGDDVIFVDGFSDVWGGRGDDQIQVKGPDNVVECGPGTDKVTLAYSDVVVPTKVPKTIGCEKIIDRR